MRLFRKKRGRILTLFADPFIGLALGRRIARQFCSRPKGTAGDGGEKESAAECPGSSLAAAGKTAGAGCENTHTCGPCNGIGMSFNYLYFPATWERCPYCGGTGRKIFGGRRIFE